MTEHTIIENGFHLHFSKYGEGKNIMLCFHGFGQDRTYYKNVYNSLGPDYTLYSFDLFFHGKSRWLDPNQPFSLTNWSEILTNFLNTYHIKKFELMGFSLGNKLVLASIITAPEKITKVTLIAPDGIKTNFWYKLATERKLTRNYFKSMIKRPERFFNIINTLKKIGFLDRGLHKFASSQMNTEAKRELVYNTWMIFSKLKFSTKKLASTFNQNKIKPNIYIGAQDKIITTKTVKNLIKLLDVYNLVTLDSNHNKLILMVAKHLKMVNH